MANTSMVFGVAKLKNSSKKIIVYPAYERAFVRISSDGRAVYNFLKMLVIYSATNFVTLDEAEPIVLAEIKESRDAITRAGYEFPIVAGNNSPIVRGEE